MYRTGDLVVEQLRQPCLPVVDQLDYLFVYLLIFFLQGNYGFLNYLDVSTGKEIADIRTKLGRCDCMTQNPHNAIIHLGHHNGKSLYPGRS